MPLFEDEDATPEILLAECKIRKNVAALETFVQV